MSSSEDEGGLLPSRPLERSVSEDAAPPIAMLGAPCSAAPEPQNHTEAQLASNVRSRPRRKAPRVDYQGMDFYADISESSDEWQAGQEEESGSSSSQSEDPGEEGEEEEGFCTRRESHGQAGPSGRCGGAVKRGRGRGKRLDPAEHGNRHLSTSELIAGAGHEQVVTEDEEEGSGGDCRHPLHRQLLDMLVARRRPQAQKKRQPQPHSAAAQPPCKRGRPPKVRRHQEGALSEIEGQGAGRCGDRGPGQAAGSADPHAHNPLMQPLEQLGSGGQGAVRPGASEPGEGAAAAAAAAATTAGAPDATAAAAAAASQSAHGAAVQMRGHKAATMRIRRALRRALWLLFGVPEAGRLRAAISELGTSGREVDLEAMAALILRVEQDPEAAKVAVANAGLKWHTYKRRRSRSAGAAQDGGTATSDADGEGSAAAATPSRGRGRGRGRSRGSRAVRRGRIKAEGPGTCLDEVDMEDTPGLINKEQPVTAPALQQPKGTYKGPDFKALLMQQQQRWQQQKSSSSMQELVPCQEHPGLAYQYGAEGLALQQGPNGTPLLLPTWEARAAAAAAAQAQDEASTAAAEASRLSLASRGQWGGAKKGEGNRTQAAARAAADAAARTAAAAAASAAATAASWAAHFGGGIASMGGQGGVHGRRKAGASSQQVKGQAGSGLYGFRAFTGLTLPQMAYYAPLVHRPQLVLLKPYEPGSYSSQKDAFARSLMSVDLLGEGAGLPPPPKRPALRSTTNYPSITSSIRVPTAAAAAAAQTAGQQPASGHTALDTQHQEPLPSCLVSLRMRFNVGCILPSWVHGQACAAGGQGMCDSTLPGHLQVRDEGAQAEQQDVEGSDQQQQQQRRRRRRQLPQALWLRKGGKLHSGHPRHALALTPLQAPHLPPLPGPHSATTLHQKKGATASRKRGRVGHSGHAKDTDQEDQIGFWSGQHGVRSGSSSRGVSGRALHDSGSGFDLLWDARVPSHLLLQDTAVAAPNLPAPSPNTPFPAHSQPLPLAGLAGQVTISCGLGSPDDAARAVDLVVLALQPHSADLAEQLAVLRGTLSATGCENECNAGLGEDQTMKETVGTALCTASNSKQLGCCRMANLQGQQDRGSACHRRFLDFLENKQQQQQKEPRLPPLNFELEEYGARARCPRRGEELRHFLALLRACPSAASGVPQLPAPLRLHPSTLHPPAGAMSLPNVGCGGCGVCRDPARLLEPCVWSGLLTGGLQWGAHPAARALARTVAAQQSQVLTAGKVLRRSHRAHITQTLILRGEPGHWLLPSAAAAATAAATAAKAGATQKLRQRAKAGWGWHAARALEAGQHDQHSSSVGAAGKAAAAAVMAAGLEAAGLGAGQGGMGEDLDSLNHVLMAGAVAGASGHPFVALQEPRPSRCKWCSGIDHDVEQCTLWGMLQPSGCSVLGTGVHTSSGTSTSSSSSSSSTAGPAFKGKDGMPAARQQQQGHGVIGNCGVSEAGGLQSGARGQACPQGQSVAGTGMQGRARRHASTRGYLVMGPSLDEGRLHRCKVDSRAVQLPSAADDFHPPKAMERGLKVLRGNSNSWRAPKPQLMGLGPLTALLDFDWLVSQEEQVPGWLWDLEPDLVEAMVAIRQAAAWADPTLMLDHPQPCLKDGGNLPSLEECLALAVLAQEAAKEEAQLQNLRHRR